MQRKQSKKYNKRNRKVRARQTRQLGSVTQTIQNPMLLNAHLSFRGQNRTIMRLVSGTIIQATNSSGTLSFVKGLDVVTDVTNFSARIGNCWNEYRVLKAVVQISLLTATPGAARAWFNIQDSTPPTFVEAEEQGMTAFALTNAGPRTNMSFAFTSTQLTALEFAPISASNNIAYWKFFTNSTNFGAVASINLFTLRVYYTVELRGLTT